MEYTQSNKKREVAKKMGLTMNGKDSGYGGGMNKKMNGAGIGKLSQKPIMSKTSPAVGKSIYTQNGKGKE